MVVCADLSQKQLLTLFTAGCLPVIHSSWCCYCMFLSLCPEGSCFNLYPTVFLPTHPFVKLCYQINCLLDFVTLLTSFSISKDIPCPGWGSEEDVELTSIMEAAESELQKATQTMQSKNRAKLLEDAETEALMEEWGLSKSIFEEEPPRSSWLCDYEKPYALAVADAPFLGEGMGPVVETRDGGSLRSMSPSNFQASSGSGQLVMQVSKPVVIPADMGSASMDILRRMAAAGMVGMADQAKLAMPLEDITGKTVEQIASEGFAALKGGYEGHINSRSRHFSSLPNWIAHKSCQEF